MEQGTKYAKREKPGKLSNFAAFSSQILQRVYLKASPPSRGCASANPVEAG